MASGKHVNLILRHCFREWIILDDTASADKLFRVAVSSAVKLIIYSTLLGSLLGLDVILARFRLQLTLR